MYKVEARNIEVDMEGLQMKLFGLIFFYQTQSLRMIDEANAAKRS